MFCNKVVLHSELFHIYNICPYFFLLHFTAASKLPTILNFAGTLYYTGLPLLHSSLLFHSGVSTCRQPHCEVFLVLALPRTSDICHGIFWSILCCSLSHPTVSTRYLYRCYTDVDVVSLMLHPFPFFFLLSLSLSLCLSLSLPLSLSLSLSLSLYLSVFSIPLHDSLLVSTFFPSSFFHSCDGASIDNHFTILWLHD